MATSEWRTAKGTCGFSVDNGTVEAAYINGIALFVFESGLSKPGKPFYSCVVTGHLSCGAESIDEAKAVGESFAMKSGRVNDGCDRRISRAQFESLVTDSVYRKRTPSPMN